jgi:hypothetical protein
MQRDYLVDSGDCPTLEKIIVSVSFSLDKVFSQFPCFGTIEEFTFSPRAELKSLQVEHITSLELELYPEEYEEIFRRQKENIKWFEIDWRNCFQPQRDYHYN